MMDLCTTGLILRDDAELRRGRKEDRVGVVLWSGTLTDPPRTAAARALGDRIRRVHPDAEVIPYAWHLVTHGVDDRPRQRGTRTLAGSLPRFGLLQDSAEVEHAWDGTRRCMEALRATRVVLATPPGFTPGALGRRRLEAFARRRRDEGIQLLWEPEGLWTSSQVAALAAKTGVTPILRGLEGGRAVRGFPPSAWARAQGMPRRPRLQGASLTALLELVDGLDGPTTVLFAGPHAQRNLRAFLEELD